MEKQTIQMQVTTPTRHSIKRKMPLFIHRNKQESAQIHHKTNQLCLCYLNCFIKLIADGNNLNQISMNWAFPQFPQRKGRLGKHTKVEDASEHIILPSHFVIFCTHSSYNNKGLDLYIYPQLHSSSILLSGTSVNVEYDTLGILYASQRLHKHVHDLLLSLGTSLTVH